MRVMTSTQDQLKRETWQARQRKLRDAMMVHIRAHGVPMPIAEYRPSGKRDWRIDLAWPVDRVALELHGGIWSDGRHVRGKGFRQDREKMNELQLLGWTVIEATPEHIRSGQAIEWVLRALPEMPRLHRA